MNGVRDFLREVYAAHVAGAEGGEDLDGFEDLVCELAGWDEDEGGGCWGVVGL